MNREQIWRETERENKRKDKIDDGGDKNLRRKDRFLENLERGKLGLGNGVSVERNLKKKDRWKTRRVEEKEEFVRFEKGKCKKK